MLEGGGGDHMSIAVEMENDGDFNVNSIPEV